MSELPDEVKAALTNSKLVAKLIEASSTSLHHLNEWYDRQVFSDDAIAVVEASLKNEMMLPSWEFDQMQVDAWGVIRYLMTQQGISRIEDINLMSVIEELADELKVIDE